MERSQRALLKLAYSKPRIYPTDKLYQECDLLSVRRIYILYATLKRHKSVGLDFSYLLKRRKNITLMENNVRTSFAMRQYSKQSTHLYKLLNNKLNIYKLNKFDCKDVITKWLKTLNYHETEELFKY